MANPTLEITRTFKAPKSLVYNAWLNAEKGKKWWGPEDYVTSHYQTDPKVGGRYLTGMHTLDESEMMWATGVYRELKADEKIVMTDSFSNEKGETLTAKEAGAPGVWPEHCLITLTFSEQAGKTTMKLRHEGIPAEFHTDCEAGWQSSFNKLERLLTT